MQFPCQVIVISLGLIAWSAPIDVEGIIDLPAISKDLSHQDQNASYYQALEVVGKSPIELIRLRGFKAQQYYARTKDGYHINLVRIINPLVSSSAKLKRPVIFNHGLLESATIWLINSRNVRPQRYTGQCGSIPDDPNALNGTLYLNGPMMLANYGYDVWLMSMRGTDFSLKHDNLTRLDSEFWDFSLDDFGLTDIPTVVDYVRARTGAPKVGYVGHSQATFSIFALLSTDPTYADIIEPVVAVAPVAYFDNITSLSRPVFLGTLSTTGRDLNGPVPLNAKIARDTATTICAAGIVSPSLICSLIETLSSGKGGDFLKGYYNHLPFYTSLKVLRHFGLLIKQKRFQRYDYGEEKNLEVYGSSEAPSYDISRIKSKKLCLISTESDALSTPKDVEHFRSQLTVPLYRDIFIDGDFDHFDVITAAQARGLVFKPLLEIFESIELSSGTCDSILRHDTNAINDNTSRKSERSGAEDQHA